MRKEVKAFEADMKIDYSKIPLEGGIGLERKMHKRGEDPKQPQAEGTDNLDVEVWRNLAPKLSDNK